MKRMLNLMWRTAVLATVLPAVAEEDGGLRESEVVKPSDLQDAVVVQPMDCRAVFPVSQIDSEALTGFNYSAIGWDLDPAEDPSRAVTITAQAGKLAKGVFTPDGSAAVEVQSGLTGTGTCSWVVNGFTPKVYQLVHAVTGAGGVDSAAQLVGYFDFSRCSRERGGVAEGQVTPGLCLTDGVGSDIRVDLQEGEVRTPQKLAWVLPFVYSPTNFIGDVAGTSSRVSIVKLTGEDPDVTTWAEAGPVRVLKDSADEGEVVWKAKKGVWRVDFEILGGGNPVIQSKFFDLRNARASGMALILK